MSGKIAVVGSLNTDLVTRGMSAPRPGETVMGSDLVKHAGGKGLNQAGAAGRMGVQSDTYMIGRVGADAEGQHLRERLVASGVDVQHVLDTDGRSTGAAMIFVDGSGQNSIAVCPGANGALTPADVTRAFDSFETPPKVVLTQLETPLPTVSAAISRAHQLGAMVIMDPAPVPPEVPEGLFQHVDLLTPNESEARTLLGDEGHKVSVADAPDVAERLRKLTGADTVILKMGEKGAYAHGDGFSTHVPAPKVVDIDTTGAGDTTNAALGVKLVEQLEAGGAGAADKAAMIISATEFAVCAGAIAVTREGALESTPYRTEVDDLWSRTFGPERTA